MLDLLGNYYSPDKVSQIVADLDLDRRGGFRSPDKILIVLFASRAGSNYFGQILCGTGWFEEIGESFAPHSLVKIRDRYGLGDLHDAAQWMIDNRGTETAFGFKAGFHVLAAAAALGFLSEVIDHAQLLLLRRRDRVAQAVSRVKGLMSGQMHSRQQIKRTLSDSDYDASFIAEHVRLTTQAERDLADLADRLGKSAPIVYYEDICADPTGHAKQVCNLLDLPMPEDYDPRAKVRLSVLRDDLSARWAARFRADFPDLH